MPLFYFNLLVSKCLIVSTNNFHTLLLQIDNSDIRSLRERLLNYLRWNREHEQPFLSARAEYADVSCNSESL